MIPSFAANFSCHNIVKFLFIDQTISVLIGFLNHFLELSLVNILSQFLYDFSQTGKWNKSGLLFVEKHEYFLQILSAVFIRNSCCH